MTETHPITIREDSVQQVDLRQFPPASVHIPDDIVAHRPLPKSRTQLKSEPTPAPIPEQEFENVDATSRSLASLSLLNRNVTRRTINTLGTYLIMKTALSAIENPVMDRLYGPADTTILVPRPFEIRPTPRVAGLISPGWGSTNGRNLTINFRRHDIYQPRFPLGYYQLSRDFSSSKIAQHGADFADAFNLREMDAHGVSMGGVTVLYGALHAKRHLRLVTLDDAPRDKNDVHHLLGAQVIAFLNRWHIYEGDLLGKYATAMLEDVDKHGLHKVVTGWLDAFDTTVTGGDPRLMSNQMRFLMESHIHDNDLKKIMDADTTLVIMKTANANTDPVTKDDQSTEKWCHTGQVTGARTIVVEVDKPGHADPYAGLRAAAPHIKHALSQMAA